MSALDQRSAPAPAQPHMASARQVADSVSTGAPWSAVRVAIDAFARAASYESLGAYVSSDPSRSLAIAAAVDATARDRGPVQALAGVPVSIKDNIAEAGQPLGACSRMLAGYRSPFSATVTARLRDAGAVPIGRTNMDEFGMGSSTETGASGPASNPWDTTLVAGGSSGGAAISVATGSAALALGTDTGGSVRLPAALCGVVGLKPSYGRVSRHGVVAYASSLEQVGLLARSVEDAALGLSVISGRCDLDATCADAAPFATDEIARYSGRRLRVGVPRQVLDALRGFGGHQGLTDEVRQRFEAGLGALAAADVELCEALLPDLDAAVPAYYVIATAEASTNLARYDGLRYGHRAADAPGDDLHALAARSRSEGLGAEVQQRILLGNFVLSAGQQDAYYMRACRVRARLHRTVAAALVHCDAIALPTAPTTAWRRGAHLDDPLLLYAMDIFTVLANLTGAPALSVPLAQAPGQLPAGLQLIGAPFGEATLCALGQRLEAQRGPLASPEPQSPGASTP